METEAVQTPEKLVAGIYSQALDILEKHGRPFYRPDGEEVSVKSFFCDTKDVRGYSDIEVKADTEKRVVNGRVIISTSRMAKEGVKLSRKITLSATGIEHLAIGEIKQQDNHIVGARALYSGGYDGSRISLEALSCWLLEAKVNLDSGLLEFPCEDSKPRRLIILGPKLEKSPKAVGPTKK